MASLLKGLATKRHNTSGISLVVDDLVPCLSPGHLAKSIAFASTTDLLRGPLDLPECDVVGEEVNVMFGPDISSCLGVAFNHEEEVIAGEICPMPDSVSLIDFETALDDNLNARTFRRTVENPFLLPSETIKVPERLHVNLSGQGLGYTDSYLQTGLLLPSLATLGPDVVRKMRKDYAEEFGRFQMALCNFARGLDEIEDERRLIRLLQETESHVVRLHDTLRNARKKYKALSGIFFAVGAVFCFQMPDPTMEMVRNYFGAVGGGIVANGVWQLVQDSTHVDRDPYYFPFVLFQEGKSRAKRRLRG